MKIYKPKSNCLKNDEIMEIAAWLEKGAIMIYPTETIYGIGCNVFDKKAVEKIYKIKERSCGQISSVMVDSVEKISEYAKVGALEREFVNRNLPGPVTIILELKEKYRDLFSPMTINEVGGVGFRVVKNIPYMTKIAKKCGFPIISTSANLSGVGVEKTSSEYVMSFFKEKVDMIDILIDAGDMGENLPSAVVDITKTPYQIIRRGENLIL